MPGGFAGEAESRICPAAWGSRKRKKENFLCLLLIFWSETPASIPTTLPLVEVNPANQSATNLTWREYNLIETAGQQRRYRREITWKQFDVAANRFANLLFTRGIRPGR